MAKEVSIGRFLSCLLALVIHGTLWWCFNIWFGNMVTIEVLGWLNAFPWYLRSLVAIMPSAGQFYLEEKWEELKHKRAILKQKQRLLEAKKISQQQYDDAKAIYEASKPEWGTLLFTTLCSTVLDLLGPAIGIVVSIKSQGGQIGLLPAIALAIAFSWGSQHFAWRSAKELWGMTGFLRDARTKKRDAKAQAKNKADANERKGHTSAFPSMEEETEAPARYVANGKVS